MQQEEFYIGWMPEAPGTFARHIRKVVILLAAGMVTAAIILAGAQKKFGTGNFEFGRLTTIKGVYYSLPVPCIKAISHKDIFGQITWKTIPLVGFGKFGAAGIINSYEKAAGLSLDSRMVTLKGTLLYNDGKALLQIDANDKPVVQAGEPADMTLAPVVHELGVQELKGEIVDPKCYFGVMKPGEGKPHKDCAIRCILGGIPPVLHVQNKKGESNYYLLAGADGQPVNQLVEDFVAEPVAITADVVQHDDWIILYMKGKSAIHPISRLSLIRPDAVVQYCSASCDH